MSSQGSDVAAAIATVRSGERYELEPRCVDERVDFLNISQTEEDGFEMEVIISVSKTEVPSDIVPVTTVDDPDESTALVDVLGREGVFNELVDAVSSVYGLPRKTVAEQFEGGLHCTRTWPDDPSVANVLFQTRFAGDSEGIRSGRLHADSLWY